MYGRYWREMGEKARITIAGWQSMSYFSGGSDVCWFLEAELGEEVRRLHRVVGNAVTEGRHIVVGTGSSQLILAALYALSPRDASEPITVLSAAPYYSSYASMSDYQKSGLYKWGGDAEKYEKEGPYIELVTSPNNPDGHTRRSVVNRTHGFVVHDLAYYWPQYTPISAPADHDLSLFTLSKSTGHAGIRLGWALVKDREVAKKMTKFIELNTIGVSKDSQLRAAKIMRVVSDSCEQREGESFFEFNYKVLVQRWKQLRAVVERSGLFSLPTFSPAFCTFYGFAWLKCEWEVEDCELVLKQHNILTRSGKHFGPCAAEIVGQPREGGKRGDAESAGCQKASDGQTNDEGCGEQDGAEDDKEGRGDGETDDGGGEGEAGDHEKKSTEREEGGEC
ncbi:Tryptophan aminotransferase-related protein 2 [Senna tora]|uniref:Tryptophan aminotransferase-related protein 2 n=1 Tax=Senna tora TaxID=362788 RepID=A0A834SLE3_9FABA|nr:Tryptophan aminotransferase-related protein 2 [Senna tora]